MDGATAVPWPPGENVKAFFSRVAALAFEQSVLRDLERRSSARLQVGNGDLIRAYRPPERGWGAGLWPKTHIHHPPISLSGLCFLSST